MIDPYSGISPETMGGMIVSIERVIAYFQQFGMADRILQLDASSATVALAAEALHCEPCRIAKTLSLPSTTMLF